MCSFVVARGYQAVDNDGDVDALAAKKIAKKHGDGRTHIGNIKGKDDGKSLGPHPPTPYTTPMRPCFCGAWVLTCCGVWCCGSCSQARAEEGSQPEQHAHAAAQDLQPPVLIYLPAPPTSR